MSTLENKKIAVLSADGYEQSELAVSYTHLDVYKRQVFKWQISEIDFQK